MRSSTFFLEQDVLESWDSKIRNLCMDVNSIVDQIASLNSKWATESMDDQMVH